MSEKLNELLSSKPELALAYDLLSIHLESGTAVTADIASCLKELVVVISEELNSSPDSRSSAHRK